jgi:CxxC-x17-CxxC domain-containing protein
MNRGRDHPRTELWSVKCSKCSDMARVPWDPKKEPDRVVLCKNCRNFYT